MNDPAGESSDPEPSTRLRVEVMAVGADEWDELLQARKLSVDESTALRRAGIRKDPRHQPPGPTVVGLLDEDHDGSVMRTVVAVVTHPILRAYREQLGEDADEPSREQLRVATDELVPVYGVRAMRLALAVVVDRGMAAASHAEHLLVDHPGLALSESRSHTEAAGHVSAASAESLVEQTRAAQRDALRASEALRAQAESGGQLEETEIAVLEHYRTTFSETYAALASEAEQLGLEPPSAELSAMEEAVAHHRRAIDEVERDQRREALAVVERLRATEQASVQTQQALEQTREVVARVVDGEGDDTDHVMVEALAVIVAADPADRNAAIVARQGVLGSIGSTVALGLLTGQVAKAESDRGERDLDLSGADAPPVPGPADVVAEPVADADASGHAESSPGADDGVSGPTESGELTTGEDEGGKRSDASATDHDVGTDDAVSPVTDATELEPAQDPDVAAEPTEAGGAAASEGPAGEAHALSGEAPGSIGKPQTESGEDDLGRAEQGLAQLVETGHLALASWAAPAAGRTAGEQTALAAAALIERAGSADGRLCRAFAERSSALSLEQLHDAPGLQRLALASAVRAQLLGLWTTNAPIVLEELRRAFDGCPAIVQLLDGLNDAAVAGAYLAPELMPAAQERAKVEEDHEEIVDLARAQVETAGKRTINYKRATAIWKSWLRPGGELREALDIAAADDGDRVDQVETVCQRFGAGSIDDRLHETDVSIRGPAANRPVEGAARTTLLRYARELVELLEAWATSARQLAPDGHQQPDQTRQQALARLRERFREVVEQAAEELTHVDGDVVDVTAARRAAQSLTRSDAILSGQEALALREPSVDTVLGRDLLRVPGVALEGLKPVREPTSVEPFVSAISKGWEQAFWDRSEEGDHAATAQIIRIVADQEGDESHQLAHQLEQRRQDEVDVERDAVHRLVQDRRRRFDRLRPVLLDRDLDVLLAARLEDLAHGPDDENYARVRRQIDEFDGELSAAVADITQRLSARRQELTSSHVDEATREHIDSLLDDGDVTSAEELIAALERGEPVAASSQPSNAPAELERALTARHAEPLSDELVEKLGKHNAVAGIDLHELEPAERERTLQGVAAWLRLRGRRGREDHKQWLPEVLRLLGLGPTPGSLNTRTDRGRRDAEYAFVAATDCHPRDAAPIPTWGSRRRGRYPLLLLWERCAVSSLLEHVRQAVGDEPLMVFLPGVLSWDERVELGRAVRAEENLDLIVVDDAVVSALAAHGGGSWEHTLQLTLPFSGANPYVPYVTGNVPSEMFFGRDRELQEMMNPDGSSFLFGGRQLGKSALLKRAEEAHTSEEPPRSAVYLDLLASEIGAYLPTGELWNRLAEELRTAGLEVPHKNYHNNPRDLEQAVVGWLEGDPQRRLLILLDECDRFLDADHDSDFATTRRLKGLMDQSGRRVKVVFAGLHQVLRFQRLTNQPFAHLGPQTPIGPLAARDARELLLRPLTALGYEFHPPELIHRVLSFTNYAPSLIQLVAYWLVRTAQTQRVADGLPPHRISTETVEEVLNDSELVREVRARFEWTVRLDPRYETLAYYLAARAHQVGPSEAISVDELVEGARQWRPADFGYMLGDEDELLGLLQEMVHLGVLALDDQARTVRLRSPNILRLIGDEEGACRALENAAKRERQGPFDRERARRRLGDGDHRRSPLSEQQLSDLLAAERDLRVVIGSRGLHIDRVPLILERAAAGLDHIVVNEVDTSASDLRQRLTNRKRSRPTLLAIPAWELDAAKFEEVLETALRSLVRLRQEGQKSTPPRVRACLIIGPQQVPTLQRTSIPGQLPQPVCVRVRRWGERAMRMWRHEQDRHDIPDQLMTQTLHQTGGWPMLLEIAQEAILEQGVDWPQALHAVETRLEEPEFCSEFLQAVGLGEHQSGLRAVARVLSTWQETGSVSIDDLHDLVDPQLLEHGDLVGCLETLGWLSIVDLDPVEDDNATDPVERRIVTLEPVVARALATTSVADG